MKVTAGNSADYGPREMPVRGCQERVGRDRERPREERVEGWDGKTTSNTIGPPTVGERGKVLG